MRAVLASSWHVLEQPPPPTLREILEAYKAKGDGDREMLLAMLNAKSSEDQRLASYATLHRTMLDMYQAPLAQSATTVLPLHIPDSHHSQAYSHAHPFPSPPASYHHSPPPSFSQPLHHDNSRQHRTHSVSSMPEQSQDRSTLPSSSSQPIRKRRRTSRSPPPHSRARLSPSEEPMSAHANDLPPSPYSSASSAQSSGGSPRSRESMAINSLLLDSRSTLRDEDGPTRKLSSERSTTMAFRER
ncbi:hypothetical protein BD309DRAFT_862949 [Dichomitus squalens]|uniref:Uncharacterized protein n=1 Tax=Dichomitus squalens TaxID=114155 RepID=A0A4Q9N342_9APHY|nr:hypothetical protein BD311DRAFT_649102 [Dichomitus squalens]TBU44134.1 hypothetical protein BD309DRAFT_862949 [Dichomitus squalens]